MMESHIVSRITLVLTILTAIIVWFKPLHTETVNNNRVEYKTMIVRDTVRITKIDTVYNNIVTEKSVVSVSKGDYCYNGSKQNYVYDIEPEDYNSGIWKGFGFDVNGFVFDARDNAKTYCDGALTFDVEVEDGIADTSNYKCDGYWLIRFKEIYGD